MNPPKNHSNKNVEKKKAATKWLIPLVFVLRNYLVTKYLPYAKTVRVAGALILDEVRAVLVLHLRKIRWISGFTQVSLVSYILASRKDEIILRAIALILSSPSMHQTNTRLQSSLIGNNLNAASGALATPRARSTSARRPVFCILFRRLTLRSDG